MRVKGSILVAVLWCVAILSVVVIGVLHTARLDLTIVKNYGDQIQAHYLALAGIEKAKALLFLEARDRKTALQNHSGNLYNAPEYFQDVSLGRGQFRIFRNPRPEEMGTVIYGISDEESRLNANTASAEELAKLPGMTPQTAAAIIDYRDSNDVVTPGGAESETYAQLRPPYLPRNANFLTLRELLMVYGVSPELFLGEDTNQNSLLDPEEDDGDDSPPRDNRDGQLDAGWSGLLTVNSGVSNVNAGGEARIDIQSAGESSLASVEGISSDLAKAIVEYRGQNRFESLADLLDVTPVDNNRQNQPPGGNGNPPNRGNARLPNGGRPNPPQIPNSQPANSSGQRLISEELLMDIADDLKVGSAGTRSGVVNINTAGKEVLACLPGLNEELADAIVSYRRSNGYFANVAWLLKVPGISREIFKQVASRISARSETFRILSEGKVTSTGARKRIEVVIRIGPSYVDTLSFREDL